MVTMGFVSPEYLGFWVPSFHRLTRLRRMVAFSWACLLVQKRQHSAPLCHTWMPVTQAIYRGCRKSNNHASAMPPKLQRRIDIVESSDAFMPEGLSMAKLLFAHASELRHYLGFMAESSTLCAMVPSRSEACNSDTSTPGGTRFQSRDGSLSIARLLPRCCSGFSDSYV